MLSSSSLTTLNRLFNLFDRLKVLQLGLHCFQLLTEVIFYCNRNVQRYQVKRVMISFSERVIRLNTTAISEVNAPILERCCGLKLLKILFQNLIFPFR